MSLEIAIILIMGFVIIYVFFIEIFSVLFRITGLTREKAKFQAISLLTNCGFTTGESEIITADKARRKIATGAMITGYAFSVIIVSLIINIFINIPNTQAESTLTVIGIAFGIFLAVILFFNLPFVKKPMEKLIEILAIKIMRGSNKENTITLLDNYGHDAIAEILINSLPQMMEGKHLYEMNLREMYRLNILMLKRKNKVLEISKDTMFQKGDIIVVFGSYQNIKDLFSKNLIEANLLLDVDDKLQNNVVDLVDNYGKDAMAEITINQLPDLLIEKTLFESGIKDKYGINVLMLKRDEKPLVVTRDTQIKLHDVLVVFGPYANIKACFIYDLNKPKEE